MVMFPPLSSVWPNLVALRPSGVIVLHITPPNQLSGRQRRGNETREHELFGDILENHVCLR